MKNLNIYLGITMIIILLLSLNLLLNRPVCEHTHFDSADRTKNIILNEEMAQKIVEIHLYCEDAGILRLYEELDYEVDVTYDEQNFEWIVHFSVKGKEGFPMLDKGRTVWIRRDNGLVTNVSR